MGCQSWSYLLCTTQQSIYTARVEPDKFDSHSLLRIFGYMVCSNNDLHTVCIVLITMFSQNVTVTNSMYTVHTV